MGSGAWSYANIKGLAHSRVKCPLKGPMVTEASIRKHQRYFDSVFGTQKPVQEVNDSQINDTVGAITIDVYGNVAAAVSTGGISLKYSGRVGDSAIPGSGFWAEQREFKNGKPAYSFACSTTGKIFNL